MNPVPRLTRKLMLRGNRTVKDAETPVHSYKNIPSPDFKGGPLSALSSAGAGRVEIAFETSRRGLKR
jgi:hypothetical protein